jgi:hypothetical protein
MGQLVRRESLENALTGLAALFMDGFDYRDALIRDPLTAVEGEQRSSANP